MAAAAAADSQARAKGGDARIYICARIYIIGLHRAALYTANVRLYTHSISFTLRDLVSSGLSELQAAMIHLHH